MKHLCTLILATLALNACTSATRPPQATATATASASSSSTPSADSTLKYPRVAHDNCWEGKAEVSVVVSPDGSGESATLLKSSGHQELDDYAIAVVKTWRFVPGKQGNKSVRKTINVPVNFRLSEACKTADPAKNNHPDHSK